jgi:hypothetical protein
MSSPPTTSITLEQAIKTLRQLPARERLKILVEKIAEAEREMPEAPKKPKKSLKGLWKGVSISSEDIDEARREMWGNFPKG